MTVKIDNKELIFSTSLLVQNEQEAVVEVPSISTKFLLRFISEKEGGNSVSWEACAGNILEFSFKNWDNPLGTCTREPIRIGESAGKAIYFQAAHFFIGGSGNFLQFYVLCGEA